MNSSNMKLKVEGIHKRFGSNEVLKGVSLSANAGDVISIIGSSGSGKSTLLHILGTLDQPDSGEMMLLGQSVAKLSANAKAKLPEISCWLLALCGSG